MREVCLWFDLPTPMVKNTYFRNVIIARITKVGNNTCVKNRFLAAAIMWALCTAADPHPATLFCRVAAWALCSWWFPRVPQYSHITVGLEEGFYPSWTVGRSVWTACPGINGGVSVLSLETLPTRLFFGGVVSDYPPRHAWGSADCCSTSEAFLCDCESVCSWTKRFGLYSTPTSIVVRIRYVPVQAIRGRQIWWWLLRYFFALRCIVCKS